MIDTGATNVSISSEVASRAGIKKCSPKLVSTANGKMLMLVQQLCLKLRLGNLHLIM